MSEQRPKRMCDSCGQVDDHPRHVFATAPGDSQSLAEVAAKAIEAASAEDRPAIIAQAQDTSTTMKHMDCCRTDGCPDGTCAQVTAGAEGKTGNALVKHLTSQPTED
jgi:hypothetical protein